MMIDGSSTTSIHQIVFKSISSRTCITVNKDSFIQVRFGIADEIVVNVNVSVAIIFVITFRLGVTLGAHVNSSKITQDSISIVMNVVEFNMKHIILSLGLYFDMDSITDGS